MNNYEKHAWQEFRAAGRLLHEMERQMYEPE